jgi:hypothetical protein
MKMFGEDRRRTTASALSATACRTILSAALGIFVFYRFQSDVAGLIVAGVALIVTISDDVKSHVDLKFSEQNRSLWFQELTTRIAMEKVLKSVRDGSEIFAESLFQEATKQAAEDVKSVDADYEQARSTGLALRHSSLTGLVLHLLGIIVFFGACSALGIFLRNVIKI